MKYIYLVFVENHDGKYIAHAETIRTGENLLAYSKRYPKAVAIHIAETATKAHYLAAEWNESYKANGTYLFD